jgi:hypothetical protein
MSKKEKIREVEKNSNGEITHDKRFSPPPLKKMHVVLTIFEDGQVRASRVFANSERAEDFADRIRAKTSDMMVVLPVEADMLQQRFNHTRRRWFDAEKTRIIEEAIEVGVSPTARKYNVAPRLMFAWVRKHNAARGCDE